MASGFHRRHPRLPHRPPSQGTRDVFIEVGIRRVLPFLLLPLVSELAWSAGMAMKAALPPAL